MVLAATQQPTAGQKPKPTSARRALEELCQTYWFPLYAYVRRRGVSAPDAQDVVQGFFARLLEKGDLAQVDRAKGRFRSFLLASISHFLSNHWAAERAAKRGGGRLISLGSMDPESRYRVEPADTQTHARTGPRCRPGK